MKRTPMGYEARLKANVDRRKRARAGKAATVTLAIVAATMWGYLFLQG